MLAETGVRKISSVACGFSIVKIHFSDYLKSLISRINEVYVFFNEISYSDILLKKHKLYDTANKLYKAALLTRCYVQHFLSPYIDSEDNHKRHFIKIPFINKGIEFIDLHSIFKNNLVISSIPNHLNNSETPIICYKYNKSIRSTIFNFSKIVTGIYKDSNTPDS